MGKGRPCAVEKGILRHSHDASPSTTTLPQAPVFYPTEEEFKDPLEFIDKICPHVQPFGIYRIFWISEMTMIDSLIELVNQIQRACTVLGDYDGANGGAALPTLWEALPSVAVIGEQVSPPSPQRKGSRSMPNSCTCRGGNSLTLVLIQLSFEGAII
ncbi:uncharacterized protein LOC103699558 [Phoenix dactylifera]|uniref:Uncharacterized protein LOC103699558 n=1 Tax=Phoenix dactylifera TaxID=42345 RepID=A0A8B7BKS0_PHODC|nr:uncharacterized protein LOC103699558 [Phoenix dactylifera]